jgi:hypothetical protein
VVAQVPPTTPPQSSPPLQPVLVAPKAPALPALLETASPSLWAQVGSYSKGIIAVASATVASLTPYYGSKPWFVALVAGIGALSVILIPNK